MSYDIVLLPRQPDQDWDAVLAADEADTPEEVLADESAMTAGVETFRRIEGRLRRFLTGDAETWVAEETGGDVLGEFESTDTGIRVELYHGSASVSLPYREADNLAGLHIKVREAVRIVAEETGYEAYDPQTRAPFDGTLHEGDLRAAALAGGAAGSGMDASPADRAEDYAPPSHAAVVHPSGEGTVDGTVADEEPAKELTPREQRLQAMIEARRDPVRVRRRAYFDLALTAAIVAWVLYRQQAGDTGFLTTVLMILAFMNLVSGTLGLRSARRLEQEKAAGTEPTPPAA